MSRAAFKKIVTADQPEAPEYSVHDAFLNRQERASLEESMATSFKGLALADVLSLQASGAQILDVREGLDFEGGHLKGALNIALAGGMSALVSRDDLVERTARITAPALAEWLSGSRSDSGPAPTVVDVRSEAEYAGGHIPGSSNIPLPHLAARLGEIPADRPVAVHCEGGYRSAIAASLFQQPGRSL